MPLTKRQGVAGIERTAKGRLWVSWRQSANMEDDRIGVCAIVTSDPDAAEPKWSAPRRPGDDIMMNKPTVLKKRRMAASCPG